MKACLCPYLEALLTVSIQRVVVGSPTLSAPPVVVEINLTVAVVRVAGFSVRERQLAVVAHRHLDHFGRYDLVLELYNVTRHAQHCSYSR